MSGSCAGPRKSESEWLEEGRKGSERGGIDPSRFDADRGEASESADDSARISESSQRLFD